MREPPGNLQVPSCSQLQMSLSYLNGKRTEKIPVVVVAMFTNKCGPHRGTYHWCWEPYRLSPKANFGTLSCQRWGRRAFANFCLVIFQKASFLYHRFSGRIRPDGSRNKTCLLPLFSMNSTISGSSSSLGWSSSFWSFTAFSQSLFVIFSIS